MNHKWRHKRIGDLGRIVTGKTPSSSRPECFGDEYPFVTPTDMHDKRYASVTERFLSQEGADSQKTLLIPTGAVCVSCIGWQMGKAIVTSRPSFTNQQLHSIIPSSDVDPLFLYYSLSTRREEFLSLGSAGGVRTPIINKSAFSDLKVLMADICLQRKIAGVLSAYDDLIENNTRRIAILEEMAQAIYREWFVHFRFPGHEQARFVDSPLGRIPEGWNFQSLAQMCSLTMGQSPSSEFYNETGNGLPFHQGVTNFGDRFPTHVTFTTVTNRMAKKGDILFSVRAPVGRLNVADTDLVVGRGVSAIRHLQSKQIFLFHQLRERFQEEDTMGGGTIFKSVTKEDMQRIELLEPPLTLVAKFEEAVGGHFEMYKNLATRNRILRLTRDLLLPKLISGQLDVEALDIETGELALEAEA